MTQKVSKEREEIFSSENVLSELILKDERGMRDYHEGKL